MIWGDRRDPEREAEIAKRYQNGETLQSIADAFGLSRQRVHQLVGRVGVSIDGLKTLSGIEIAEARRLRSEGMTWVALSRRFGCARDTVKRALDPTFRQHRAEGIKAAKENRKQGVEMPRGRPANFVISEGTAVARDAARLMALVPKDTRPLTARLFGDPLPGRSALDQRKASA